MQVTIIPVHIFVFLPSSGWRVDRMTQIMLKCSNVSHRLLLDAISNLSVFVRRDICPFELGSATAGATSNWFVHEKSSALSVITLLGLQSCYKVTLKFDKPHKLSGSEYRSATETFAYSELYLHLLCDYSSDSPKFKPGCGLQLRQLTDPIYYHKI